MPRTIPGKPRRMMHQSNPGVRRLRLSHPSIHFPRSVYSPSRQTGALAFNRFSFGAKKSSLANSTAPPSFSEARSISSVNSIATKVITKSTRGTKGTRQKGRSSQNPDSGEDVLPDFKFWTSKIDEQSVLHTRCPKITKQLCSVTINQGATTLYFANQDSLYQDISSE